MSVLSQVGSKEVIDSYFGSLRTISETDARVPLTPSAITTDLVTRAVRKAYDNRVCRTPAATPLPTVVDLAFS